MSCWRLWPSVMLVCCSLLLTQAQGQQYSDEITHPVEVIALKTIRKSLDDSILKNLSNWGHGDPCTSNWTGVLCYNSTMKDGYLHVEELQLLGMKLSGNLSPGLGHLTHMRRLNFMWNNISGSIPKEIGNITSLELLLLNGNQITGSLPEEIGYLPHLDRIQIDQNQISGQLPSSFANLNKTKHFHMNNNSISGPIPPELSRLPNLVHLLLDNNNLSGSLPSELSKLPNLLILQLDNNNFGGSGIPASYGDMSKLLKLSLRNCNLHGRIPDLSRIPHLAYIDLSSNQLNGSIPPEKLSMDITTIDLSENNLTGTIPTNFSDFPSLQRLSLSGNSLSGTIPSTIWHNWTSDGKNSLSVFLQNNMLSNFSGSLNLPPNVTVWLQGNPICSNANIIQFCGSPNQEQNGVQSSTNYSISCRAQECPPPYEYASESSVPCFCAAPLLVGYRLKSPGFWDFLPYFRPFEDYLTSGLSLDLDQLSIASFVWEEGPRLKIYLKLFPEYNVSNSKNSHVFNKSEVQRITSMFTGWNIPDSNTFGPYELLNLTLLDLYKDDISISSKSGVSKGALAGIVVGAILGAVALSAVVSLLIVRTHLKGSHAVSKRRLMSRLSLKIGGLREFTYGELELATNNFNVSSQIGQGGYGKVYKGILADGTVVAIKRAQEGSLQGQKEFLTEIELLSRLHHRNLVSLVGYCDEEGEQMLIYEFMSNGSLRDHLSGKSKEPLSFAMRLRIALASAKGILYLHTEADPPIFHRDIKATNILLDSKFTAKVADFGLSRLAPVPEIDGHVPAHVSTVVKGTPGYLDPEYFLTHKLTDKSDVYSLGVVFLELLTGMQPISHGKNIVREVNVAYHSGTILSVIDKGLGSYPFECMEKFLNLALKCCQDETDVRPFMAEVVRELENICLLVPDADSTTKSMRDSTLSSGKDKEGTSQSSPSTMRNPFLSSDISGSDLVSGTFPTIVPR